MKRALNIVVQIFLAIFFIYGCTSTVRLTERSYEEIVMGIDFRHYNEMGFLFYTEEYYGHYEVLGIIEVEIHPEVKYKSGRVIEEKQPRSDDIYQSPTTKRLQLPEPESGYNYQIIRVGGSVFTKNVQRIHIDEVVNQMYELSIEWGGDAISHFKANIKIAQTDDYLNTSYPYYSITGLVIKRK